ncbi:MAG: Rha family transcriptional regulator [Bilophila sp.]
MEKCSQEFNERNFAPVEYTDAKGEKRPMYLLSKDGFMMVAMAYITPEAMRIKEAYIARFNDMERELAGRNPSLPQTYADALRALAAEVEIRQAVEQQKALAESQRDEAIRTKSASVPGAKPPQWRPHPWPSAGPQPLRMNSGGAGTTRP